MLTQSLDHTVSVSEGPRADGHCWKWRLKSCKNLMYFCARLRLGQLQVAVGTLAHKYMELRRGSGEQHPGWGGPGPLHGIKIK